MSQRKIDLKMTKVIVITSGKGGVGKTNISVNTAVELARRGYRTCLFDADLGLANANILLGIHPEKSLDDFVFKGEKLEDIIVSTEFGFDIIPGSSGIEEMANLGAVRIAHLVKGFNSLTGYDHFLIDTSSGISKNVISLCLAAEETVLIITSEATSLTDAYGLLKVLALNNYKGSIRIVVNKCTSIPKSRETYLHFKSVADKHLAVHLTPIGAVLHDPNIEKAVAKQKPVLTLYPETIASQCIRAMVINLIGNETDTEDEKNFNDFWTRYFKHISADQPLTSSTSANLEKEPLPDGGKAETTPPGNSPQLLSASEEILAILDSMEFAALSSPCQLFCHTLHQLSKGQLSHGEMRKIISCDPVLTIKVKQLFHATHPDKQVAPVDIGHIIDILGVDIVSKWLQTSATQAALSTQDVESNIFLVKLWHHSYSCALLAKSLAENINYPAPEEVFLSALLHNIGRLVLQSIAPGFYVLFPDFPREDEELPEAELNFFTRDHAEQGAKILQKYNFNSYTVDGARYHLVDRKVIETALPSTRLVYLANQLCSASSRETSEIAQYGESLTGIPAPEILQEKKEVKKKVDSTTELFNIPFEETNNSDRALAAINLLKSSAAELIMIQGMIPATLPDDLTQHIYRGLDLLFGLRKTICLLPDPQQHDRLIGTGNPPTLHPALTADIQIPLRYDHSVITKTFYTGTINIARPEEIKVLVDQQLLNVLESELLVSIPLHCADKSRGVIVAGVGEDEVERIETARKRLLHFTAQVATSLPTT